MKMASNMPNVVPRVDRTMASQMVIPGATEHITAAFGARHPKPDAFISAILQTRAEGFTSIRRLECCAMPERRFGAVNVLSQREVALPESELSAVSLATLAQLGAVPPLRAFPAGPTLTAGVNLTPPSGGSQ
jgi:hypothetical protein